MVRTLPRVWHRPFLMETGLSRLVDEFFRDFDDVGFEIAPSFGRTDIYEKDQNLVFETELPGMKKDEIEIKVEKNHLVVSGEMKRSEEVNEENYFRVGRRYGRFQRCFPLPENMVEKPNIKARFEDGILKIYVPLKQSIKEKEKPIEVKVE
jgi:HSP20 family protein